MKKNKFCSKYSLNLNGELFNLDTPAVMGILNITDNSFYEGSRYISDKAILQQTEKMLNEGADFIDLGANSTKPGAEIIDESLEIKRIENAVKLIKKEFGSCRISVDTFRAKVAEVAINEGAVIVNDVSGGEMDKNMFSTVAKYKVSYVLMHMRGNPAIMQQMTHYENLIKDIAIYLAEKIKQLTELGVNDIIIDPGFGFAKTIDQNFEILKRLQEFQLFEKPVLAGISRKSMIYKTLNTSPENALNGTTVLNTFSLINGANILRVHDVKEAKEAVILNQKLA